MAIRPTVRQTRPPSTQAWNGVARLLHWLMALLIFGQFALGWLAVTWPMSPAKFDLFIWHKSNGMLVLVLVVLRLVWRVATQAPPPPDAPAWERAAARASHALLYGLMLAMPLSGWVVNSAAGIPFRVFRLWPLPPIVAPDAHLAHTAEAAHFWLGMGFAALLALHVAAAFWHHLHRHDDVLRRMLGGRSARR